MDKENQEYVIRLAYALEYYRSKECNMLRTQAIAYALRLLSQDKKTGQKCITVDIDDCAIDTTDYMRFLVKNQSTYPFYWKQWCARADMPPFAQVLTLAATANNMGVPVYFVSRRNQELHNATVANLEKAGYPVVDHVLCCENKQGKLEAFESLAKQYRIALAVDDNDGDINHRCVDNAIIFPNPCYGQWA